MLEAGVRRPTAAERLPRPHRRPPRADAARVLAEPGLEPRPGAGGGPLRARRGPSGAGPGAGGQRAALAAPPGRPVDAGADPGHPAPRSRRRLAALLVTARRPRRVAVGRASHL